MSRRQHLLLFDFSNLVMRIFYRRGQPKIQELGEACVQAVKGGCREFKATLAIAALDPLDGHCFEYDMYEDYKKPKDGKVPEITACELVREVAPYIEEAGIYMVDAPTYQADHIIATLTRRAVEKESTVSILSRDRDLFALCRQGRVRALYPEKGKEQVVKELDVPTILGVTVRQMTEWRMLAGDENDNIPRIGAWDREAKPYGFTEKRAAALLSEFGTLRCIYEEIDSESITERERAWLKKDEPTLKWKRDLVRLRTDVPLPDLQPQLAAVANMGIEL